MFLSRQLQLSHPFISNPSTDKDSGLTFAGICMVRTRLACGQPAWEVLREMKFARQKIALREASRAKFDGVELEYVTLKE